MAFMKSAGTVSADEDVCGPDFISREVLIFSCAKMRRFRGDVSAPLLSGN